jgi:hypothetical protein
MRRVAALLRRVADRIDHAGAPKRTSWSFTFEEGLGVVFNESGSGCPLWYYGDTDYQRAHNEARFTAGIDSPEWVTIGFRGPAGLTVFGSADIPGASLSRRMDGFDRIPVRADGGPVAKVPRWVITLNCQMRTWVQATGDSYPAVVAALFRKSGGTG